MKNKLDIVGLIMSIIVGVVTISVAVFAWTYVLQILAKAGVYGVGNLDAIDFFASGNFAHIGYDAYMAVVMLFVSKFFLKQVGIIIFMLFCAYSVAVVGSILDRRRRVKMTEPKFIKLNAIINTFFSHYKVFLYPLFALVIFYGCFVFLFLGNVGILKDIQYSITHDNKGRVSTYCSILLHKNSESQTLRMNLDNNYKLSWTYYGLAKSSLDGKDLYYPNKLDDKRRNELIKLNC